MPRWTSKGWDWQETGTQSRQIRNWGWNGLFAVWKGLLEWKSVRSSRNSFSKSKPWQAIMGWIHTKKSSLLFLLFSPSFEDRPNTTGKEKKRHRTTKQWRERNKLLRNIAIFSTDLSKWWHWKATNNLIRKYKMRIFCPPTHSTPCLNINIKFSSLCSSVNNSHKTSWRNAFCSSSHPNKQQISFQPLGLLPQKATEKKTSSWSCKLWNCWTHHMALSSGYLGDFWRARQISFFGRGVMYQHQLHYHTPFPLHCALCRLDWKWLRSFITKPKELWGQDLATCPQYTWIQLGEIQWKRKTRLKQKTLILMF